MSIYSISHSQKDGRVKPGHDEIVKLAWYLTPQ